MLGEIVALVMLSSLPSKIVFLTSPIGRGVTSLLNLIYKLLSSSLIYTSSTLTPSTPSTPSTPRTIPALITSLLLNVRLNILVSGSTEALLMVFCSMIPTSIVPPCVSISDSIPVSLLNDAESKIVPSLPTTLPISTPV